jgi:hypothetical protein
MVWSKLLHEAEMRGTCITTGFILLYPDFLVAAAAHAPQLQDTLAQVQMQTSPQPAAGSCWLAAAMATAFFWQQRARKRLPPS